MKRLALILIILILLTIFSVWLWIPSGSKIQGCLITTMYSLDLCPGSKNYVPFGQISKNIQNAILLTEDSGFYSHNGFDPEGIQRCYEKFKEKGKIVCGGSTITQQLAKNMFLYKEKNFLRKGLEALITLQIERTLPKKAIFERYLNIAQFGKDIYGVKQAAEFYFKKSASNLTVQESAFLAMVLPSPEKYSQSYYRKDLTKFARRRLTQIIENMYKYKSLSEEQYVSALAKLDSFLLQGQQKNNSQPNNEILTDEDLDEMTN